MATALIAVFRTGVQRLSHVVSCCVAGVADLSRADDHADDDDDDGGVVGKGTCISLAEMYILIIFCIVI